jgi:hypothetical protein
MCPPTSPLYPFSPAELARFNQYRAAIEPGVYTDQINQPSVPLNPELPRAGRAEPVHQ